MGVSPLYGASLVRVSALIVSISIFIDGRSLNIEPENIKAEI